MKSSRPAKLLIHIGLHKTASTWMQRLWFLHDQLPFVSPWSRNTLADDFIRIHPLDFEPDKMKKKYEPLMDQLHSRGKTTVFSYEEFSGCPGSGGYDFPEIAHRLGVCFPYAHTMVIIRRQQDLILSYYKQYVRDGGGATLEEFLYPPEPDIRRVPFFRAELYQFHYLVTLYQRLFSPSRVLVVPYERLRKDPENVFFDFLKYTGHPTDLRKYLVKEEVWPSMTPTQTIALQELHRLHWRSQFNPTPAHPLALDEYSHQVHKILAPKKFQKTRKDIEVEDMWKGVIQDYSRSRFIKSNNVVQEITGVDLSLYGYDL